MLTMNRRGIVYEYLLFFLTIGFLGYAGYALLTAGSEHTLLVGKEADRVLESAQEAKYLTLYLDEAGSYAYFTSVGRLIDMVGGSTCGQITVRDITYYYLETPTETCYPTDLLARWSTFFNEALNPYLTEPIIDNNYLIKEKEGAYVAFMQIPITLTKEGVLYTFKRDLPYTLTFDVSLFNDYLSSIRTYSLACKEREDRLVCWEESLKTNPPYTTDVTKDGNLFMFKTTTEDSIAPFFGEKEVVFYFAIDYRSALE